MDANKKKTLKRIGIVLLLSLMVIGAAVGIYNLALKNIDTRGKKKEYIVDIPVIGNTVFTYDAEPVYIEESYCEHYVTTEDSVFSAIDAGTYNITYHLLDTTKSEWADGTTDDIVYAWTIKPREISIKWDVLQKGLEHTLNYFEGNEIRLDYQFVGTTDTDIALINDDVCELVFAEGKDACLSDIGTKEVVVTGLTNSNYILSDDADTEFTLEMIEGIIPIEFDTVYAETSRSHFNSEFMDMWASSYKTMNNFDRTQLTLEYSLTEDGEYTEDFMFEKDNIQEGDNTFYWRASADKYQTITGTAIIHLTVLEDSECTNESGKSNYLYETVYIGME